MPAQPNEHTADQQPDVVRDTATLERCQDDYKAAESARNSSEDR